MHLIQVCGLAVKSDFYVRNAQLFNIYDFFINDQKHKFNSFCPISSYDSIHSLQIHYGYIGYTENWAGVEIVEILIMLVVVVLPRPRQLCLGSRVLSISIYLIKWVEWVCHDQMTQLLDIYTGHKIVVHT